MTLLRQKSPDSQKSPPHRLRLTDIAIARAPALERPYRMWDTKVPGLYVRVQPSGIRSYNVQWSRTGSTAIGKHPHHTLEWARGEAHRLITETHDRGTPAAAQRKARRLTFADFVSKHYAPWVKVERRSGAATVANLKAQFGKLFDTKPLAEITTWSVEKFRAKRLKDGILPATVNRDLDRLRAALNKAIAWGLLDTNPVSLVKRSRTSEERVRYLSGEEEKRLREALAARETDRRQARASANAWARERGYEARPEYADDDFTDHLTPLVHLAMNTGLRRGELLGLTWPNVHLERKQLTVSAGTAKSGRVRHVPLNSEALDVLERWKKHRGGEAGFVFPGAGDGRMSHINTSWRALVKAAELKDFHFHDLRHHFASRLVMGGVDLYVVKELLGHADFTMTQRYAHLTPEHKAAAVEKLVAAR